MFELPATAPAITPILLLFPDTDGTSARLLCDQSDEVLLNGIFPATAGVELYGLLVVSIGIVGFVGGGGGAPC